MRKLLLGLLLAASVVFAGNDGAWTNSGGALNTQARTISVTPVSSGVTDGQSVTFTGTGFGTNSATLEWTGGPSGWIESGTVGNGVVQSAHTGWSEDFGATSPQATRFSSTRAWSGSKSMRCETQYAGGDGRFGLLYDMGAASRREFLLDYLVYFDNAGITSGQWKMMRLVYDNTAPLTDGVEPSLYFRRSLPSTGTVMTVFNSVFDNNWGYWDQAGESGDLPSAGGWYRVRWYHLDPSSFGASDGETQIRVTRMSDGAAFGKMSRTGVQWYTSGETHTWRYLVFQNYMGNGYEAGASNVFMDDILVVKGGKKHLRLCNASTYAASTQCEAATWSSWSDTSITAIVNKGGFADLTGKYWYVMSNIDTPINSSGILLQSFWLFARRRRAANDDNYRAAA